MRSLYLLVLSLPLLTGCIAAGVAAGTEAGVSLAEERSLGRKVDDTVIYTDINRLFLRTNNSDLFAGVTINVRHARVMLTGNVNNEATAQQAVQLAWQARGVEEVINEVTVNPGAGLTNNATDTLIKTNLESRLLITKEVWLINYSIDVVNGSAYLLGRVHDQGELDRVLSVARTTKGVKRVVNYLQIRPEDDAPRPAVSPYASPATTNSYTPSSGPAAAPALVVTPPVVVPADQGYTPEAVTSSPLPPASN